MTDWVKVLRTIAPKGKRWIINGVAAAMPKMIEMAHLNTPRRIAHFLAQCAHESDGFNTTKEYASGAAYEGRDDLGNTQRGDGVRFKGRGIIQNTGRGSAKQPLSGYNLVSAVLGVDFVSKPELLEKFPYAALAAAVFWNSKAMNAAADRDDVSAVTKLVNGGYNGLAARQAYLKAAKRALAAPQAKAAPSEKEVTAAELRKAGSRTIDGADEVKRGIIGVASSASVAAGTAAVNSGVDPSEVISKVSDAAEQAKNIHDAAQAAPDMWANLQAHWEWVGIAVLLAACAYFAWKAWSGAKRVEAARVDDANSSLRLGG